MKTYVKLKPVALVLALVSTLMGCQQTASGPSTPVLATQASEVVGDGRLEPGEQCDDGNTTAGDGCSATGTVEPGFLCYVPGKPCSRANLCGNGTTNSGEACDDGTTTDEGNGCSATCDLSLCGNNAFDNRQHPSYAQEVCDDGNRFEGDGCSRLCEVEPGFACAGSPSRCVRAGVVVFNTGVDQNNRRLETGADPHWFYRGTTTGAATYVRDAFDWPQEIQTARFLGPLGNETCVYQDFLIPSTTNITEFRLRLATFNDNQFTVARVNNQERLPVVVNEPPGMSWQKNIFREFGRDSGWRPGVNRIELCNENGSNPPNASRYLFVDAYDDRCGDGAVSLREECDDNNTASGDGCSASCGIEPGYGCVGAPSACAQTCGNAVLNPGEQCDDGDLDNGDGCNASCRIERGYTCPTAGQECEPICGDGNITAGEQCDDGNTLSSDGCSGSCRRELGYECFGEPSVCAPLCGNGRLNPGELCDDGNTRLGDGCSNACTLELGYACPTPGQACVRSCGNGNVDPGEQCDDGNVVSQDGCSTECSVEPRYACSTPASGPSVCALTCGNGMLEANEACDDGNVNRGDGCSPGCRVEPGYSCGGQPSACVTLCGDGITAGTERCDDGNRTSGDGCNDTCQVEPGYRCPSPGNVCFATCGNGTVEQGETCDDGNTTNGDGCTNICAEEAGYTCTGAPSICRATCGDGVRTVNEVCDDGNLRAGDGCSARCLLENGQSCQASNVCDSGRCNPDTDLCEAVPRCGDGALDEGELCDDGNTTAGDGCNATCTAIEAGYSCTGIPSVCAVTCGDGVQAASEACDDGNTTANDGCSAACAIEPGFGCQNEDVRQYFTRQGRTQCTQVTDLASPALPAGAAQASLEAPGRYRLRYVAGAVGYSGNASWYPGIFGVSSNPGGGTQGFSLGRVPEAGSASRNAAMGAGFPLTRDFEAATGDVRLALIDTDCAQNDNTETAVTYRVDSLAICQRIPVVVNPTPGGTTGPVITGTASPGTTLRVYLDGSSTPICTTTADAGGNWSCNLGNTPDGQHTVRVTSTVLSATEASPSVPFTLSRAVPSVPVITGPVSGRTVSTQTPPITGTGEAGSTVTVREGNTVICTATVDGAGNWSCTPTTPLSEGPHTITAVAISSEGGTSAPSNPVTFIVDVTAPPAPVITGPAAGSTTTDTTPDISGTSEPRATVTVREGNTVVCTAIADAAGNWTCVPTTPLAQGPHTLVATAQDAAGNTGPASAPHTFTVDNVPPDTSFSRTPDARGTDTSADFGYASTESGVRYECSLDGGTYAACQDTYDVGLGQHTLRVRAVDAAGNVDPTPAEYTWTVEAPVEEDNRTFAGGGCSAAPASGWLALLALLGVRRRSRRS
jgi:cysteine-rich repeat protein